MDPANFNPTDIFTAKDLVIVITGGGTGIGLAFATALLKTGAAKIYILGRRLDVLKSAASSLDESGKRVIAVQCDVANIENVKTVAEQVRQEVGYVDVLINNAGITGPDHKTVHKAQSIAEIQEVLLGQWDKWESAFAINTAAVAGVSAAFLDLLDKANARRGFQLGKMEKGEAARKKSPADGIDQDDFRSSQVITVASIAAYNRFLTAGLGYASSKAGAVAIGKSLASLLAPWGIRSNLICPGSKYSQNSFENVTENHLVFPSEMTQGAKQEFPYDEIPAHRQGNLNELAGTLLYMVGKSGAYLNGSVQVVDGGRLSVMYSTY